MLRMPGWQDQAHYAAWATAAAGNYGVWQQYHVSIRKWAYEMNGHLLSIQWQLQQHQRQPNCSAHGSQKATCKCKSADSISC